MAAESYDNRRRLMGRSLVGIATPIDGSAASRLSRWSGEVPFQRSVLVYTNGDVVEKEFFTVEEITASNVHTFIRGGTDFRESDDTWLNAALVAQGYTFE